MHKQFKSKYPKFDEVMGQCFALWKEHSNWPENDNGQIAIQTNDTSTDNWFAGTGKSESKTAEWEQTFNHLQPSLVGTPVDEYIKWLDVPVYRARVMLSKSKSCYSVHRDYSPRLHLPLVTNPQCNFLIVDPLQFFHMPADGTTTWVDTRKPHTFMNGSLSDRYHLVMIVKE